MEQLQSFRTELVEWLKEIVPFSKLDLYTRKTREGLNVSLDAGRHDNHVNYIICTDKHRYSISATPTYLGCIVSTTFYRPGEDWTRGNDLPDGKFCRATWEDIKDAILRFELVKLVPAHESSSVGLPDASNVPNPTPVEVEYQTAHLELFRATERFKRAERAMTGQNIQDQANQPLDMAKVATYHAAEQVG